MKRLLTYLSIGFVFGFFSWSTNVSAQGPKPPVVTEKPAGLRVMNGGHSWSTEHSAPLCQAAGIVGHKKITGINGNIIKDVTPLLEKGEIDVYVWQRSEVGPESPSFLPTLVELGPKHNPNFRVHIQLPWLVHDGRQGVKLPEEYEKTDLAEYQAKLEKSRKKAEDYVDAVNAKAGTRIVFLVPLADGMLEVRKLIVAGKFPGLKYQSYREKLGDRGSVLGGDHMPHQGLIGMRLGSYMHFAAIYRMSPEGLKFPGKEGDGLTDEQRPILQKLAWDMVSKYPYAGIAKAPATSQTDEKKGNRMLFLGNSITLHPPAEGMTGSWGMAASSAEKDYVHLVLSAFEKRNGKKPESKVVNLADFERGFEQYDLAAKLKAEIEFQADTVILAIGENVPDLKTEETKLKFRESVSRLLKLLKADRRCTIYVRSCFWPNAGKDSALKEACATVGGVFVDISALSKDEKNYARSERKFANTGIAIHPGDKGMSAIADRIVAAIKEYDVAKTESKPAPNAVPEALKGWKATNDLPADTVVIDYNEYIEKLPKAERPGVSNVKYYVDDTGRNAVAVLVIVGDTPWTHLLVYDKMNKRIGVTKFASK